jgi:hypothetical protein
MSQVRTRRSRRVGRLLPTAVVVGLVVSMLLGIAVARAPGSVRSSAGVRPDLLCNGGSWQTTHLEAWASGCQALFGVNYAENFSSFNASQQYNFSFAIDWIAEFTPEGQIVRAASPLAPSYGTANATESGNEVNLTARYITNVTNATGNWTPNDLWRGTGPQWNASAPSVGTTLLNVVFHLSNVPVNASANVTRNSSLAVKFDVGIATWPWASSDDLLGFDLESLGAGGAHFAFNTSSRTLAERWNQDNTTFASLVFGPQANVTYSSDATVPSNVTEAVGLFDAATPAREAVSLVTLGDVAGGYVYASYDPWVEFSPTGLVVPPGASPPMGTAGFPPWLAVALSALALTAGLGLIGVYTVRSSVLRREGAELVAGMREAISRVPRPARPK